MSAVPKIIIKPQARAPAPPPSDPDTPEVEDEEAAEEADGEEETDDAATPMDVDNASEEGAPVAPTKRGRGRPRGRGRGSTASGASTPRARGRGGRGRGRGRGRGAASVGGSLTIRLPKRTDEDGEADEEVADADGEAATEGEAGEIEEKEIIKELPIGGGKPFRKIQGKVYIIDGDEFITEDDPKGDQKIDQWGSLLGGMHS